MKGPDLLSGLSLFPKNLSPPFRARNHSPSKEPLLASVWSNVRGAHPKAAADAPHGMILLALRPDGRRVAVSVDSQRLQLWDLKVLHEQFQELGLDWADNR